MNISLATREDVHELCALLETLFSQEAEFAPDRKLQEKGLAEIIENPGVGSILVARDDSGVLGMVNLLYTISTALGGRVALLEDMVVTSASRGKGVGSALLKHGLELAKKKNCLRISLLTDADNYKAHKFYERHGFSRSSMTVFRKSLV